MSGGVPVAFYAPLKSPAHPVPSGDRAMARLLLKALAAAGFAPELVSELRTWEPAGEPERQARLRESSREEAVRLAARCRSQDRDRRPRLWFTYHSYYKAPDWLGPVVAEELGIPYVLAEASRAGKRARGPFALAHAGAEAALSAAAVVFALTGHDREALERSPIGGQSIVDLPPFLDLEEWTKFNVAGRPSRPPGRAPRLLAVGMMRSGDKLASYRELAAALRRVEAAPWTLDMIGDGAARAEVESAFAFASGRVAFRGLVEDPAELARSYREADLLVWPAVNEAYGMALLEAQAFGCPVLAGRHGGVASAVSPGRSAVLTPPGDVEAFARELDALLAAPERLARLSDAAERFVAAERTIPAAAAILRSALAPLLEPSPACLPCAS